MYYMYNVHIQALKVKFIFLFKVGSLVMVPSAIDEIIGWWPFGPFCCQVRLDIYIYVSSMSDGATGRQAGNLVS